MSGPEQKKQLAKIDLDDLEINPETLKDLTDAEAGQAQGGMLAGNRTDNCSRCTDCSCPVSCQTGQGMTGWGNPC